MDLSRELLEAISLNWEDEEWIQPIDYEQLPFRCRLYHEYGHLGRNCPKHSPRNDLSPPSLNKSAEDDGFTQVKNRRRSKGGGKPSVQNESMTMENKQGNSIEALGTLNEGEEVPATPMVEDQHESPTKVPMEEESQQIIGMEEVDGEDMDLGELDFDAIEEQ